MRDDNIPNSNYSGLEELQNLEVMNNYNSFIVHRALSYINKPKTVVDFGAGIGTLALIFREDFFIEPICIEQDINNLQYIKKRKFKTHTRLSNLSTKADLIFSSNVLEHIKDDISILKEFHAQLSEKGKIFLYLPALMVLWSGLDKSVGHYRRYVFSELKEKCNIAGFKIEKLHYSDSIGFFATFFLKLFGYKKSKGLASASSLKFYDKYLFPLSKFLDKIGLKYLFGKNIILVARKI